MSDQAEATDGNHTLQGSDRGDGSYFVSSYAVVSERFPDQEIEDPVRVTEGVRAMVAWALGGTDEDDRISDRSFLDRLAAVTTQEQYMLLVIDQLVECTSGVPFGVRIGTGRQSAFVFAEALQVVDPGTVPPYYLKDSRERQAQVSEVKRLRSLSRYLIITRDGPMILSVPTFFDGSAQYTQRALARVIERATSVGDDSSAGEPYNTTGDPRDLESGYSVVGGEFPGAPEGRCLSLFDPELNMTVRISPESGTLPRSEELGEDVSRPWNIPSASWEAARHVDIDHPVLMSILQAQIRKGQTPQDTGAWKVATSVGFPMSWHMSERQ